MTPAPIGVGVIGCGEITQIVHLPLLDALPDLRPVALCDLSADTAGALAARYDVAHHGTEYAAVLDDPDVDAVLVATYDHAPVVADALAAGKHVLVEKPVAFTPAEARPLVAAAEERGLVAIVGYMKLYDAGVELGLEQLRRVGRPRSVEMHDLAGSFAVHAKHYRILRGKDVPPGRVESEKASVHARITDALGPALAGHAELYTLLLMLGSHDLAVLRAAYGAPERVAFARAVSPQQLLAVLDLAGGVPCVLQVGAGAEHPWWDEWLVAYGDEAEVRIEFSNPYVRYAPTTVQVRERDGENAARRTVPVAHEEPFRRQWRHFAACIRGELQPRTPLRDGLTDLEVAGAIIAAMDPVGRGGS